jgi:hypothetical protein
MGAAGIEDFRVDEPGNVGRHAYEEAVHRRIVARASGSRFVGGRASGSPFSKANGIWKKGLTRR